MSFLYITNLREAVLLHEDHCITSLQAYRLLFQSWFFLTSSDFELSIQRKKKPRISWLEYNQLKDSIHLLTSLRSKRFRGVSLKRKTEKWAFRCFD